MVQLGTIPLELRALAGLQPVPPDPTSKIDPSHTKKKPVKYRYGAWYLRPNTWKRSPKDEKLEDPYTKVRIPISEINNGYLESFASKRTRKAEE